MMRGDISSWGRRKVLKLIGVSTVGATAFSQTGVADEEEADVAVRFNDQESDGTSVVIESLSTDVEAEVFIFHAEGDRQRYKTLNVEAGTEFSDRTVELDEPIPETQLISISVQPPEGSYSYGGSRATVAVGESLDDGPSIELVESDPDAGFNYPYYLYIPERGLDEGDVPLLVQPNNSNAVTDNFEKHLERAEETINGVSEIFASRLDIPALVPVFPRPREEPVDGYHLTHHLDDQTLAISSGDLERIDLQLLQMVEHARDRLTGREYPITDDGILMNGFSASGTFADRFTMLHPDEVLSVTAGGVNGMPILPLEEVDGRRLPYHVGIANVDELIGKSPNLDALNETRQFIYMGGDDENDTIPFNDAWTDDELRQLALDVYGEDMIDDRFARSEELYEKAGIDAEFHVYEGVGHIHVPAVDDIVEFHLQTVEKYRSSFLISVEWPTETVETNTEVSFLIEIENVVDIDLPVTVSIKKENESEATATMDGSVEAKGIERVESDNTFNEPGEYVISVNGSRAESSLTVVDPEPTEDEEVDDRTSDDTEQTAEPESEQDEPTAEDQSGFGVVQTIAALGGIGYLIKRRIFDNE